MATCSICPPENSAEDDAMRSSSVLTEDEVAAASDNHTHCLVCYSDLTTRGKIGCNHNDICGVCHLRLRFLHNDKKCPICKTENEYVIVDRDPSKTFSEYPMWGDEIGAGFENRPDVGMFFESAYYDQEIRPLFGYACQHQACTFCPLTAEEGGQSKKSPLRLLKDHLRTQHRLTLCNLCVENKRDFVSRLPRFTPSQLQKHMKNGDGPTSGFLGHPLCEFCKPKRFYDLAGLHQHLHKEHYKCHICEKQGLDNQFFKNYRSLERHFDQQHFMCHDVQCLAARFVVFENELDLRAHELSVHGGTSTGSTKINLEFRTRRAGYDGSGLEERNQAPPSESDFNYGLDGQAFVPQALPNSNGTTTATGNNNRNPSADAQLHPQHLQRTEELRAQAAEMRRQQSLQSAEESFPSLQSANAASSAPLVGWTSAATMQRVNLVKKEAGKVTEEDYPTLGPAPSATSNAKKKKVKGSLAATRRQFGAMTTSASQPAGGWGGGQPVAPRPTSAQTSNFLTPPAGAMRASGNRQSDLTPNNFPSLGPSTNPRSNYTAANNYSKKLQNQASSQFRTPQQPKPAINSAADFPSMAAANQSNNRGTSVADRALRNQDRKPPAAQATANILQASTSAASSLNAKATVEEMKASLGPKKFKQLKRLTKDFSENQLSAEGYVDQAAALFDKGYADSDFWSFMPSLLESCPNEASSMHALQYMTSIRRQQFSDPKPGRPRIGAVAAAPAAVQWGKQSSASNNIMKAPPRAAAPTVGAAKNGSFGRPQSQWSGPPMTTTAARPNNLTLVPSKSNKKSAWGATGPATVVRAKAPPGSVAVAAANQRPQGGTATKFMAKQTKQQQAAASSNSNSNKKNNKQKKKKQKDELRALAFGK